VHKENLIHRTGITFADSVILLVLILVFSFFLFQHYNGERRISHFSVKTDVRTVILNPEQDRDLAVESSGYHYLVRVRKGTIWVFRADCPDKLCIRMGSINSPGERIICIPGKLVITAEGKDEFDAVNR
jgi:hypothetical protein